MDIKSLNISEAELKMLPYNFSNFEVVFERLVSVNSEKNIQYSTAIIENKLDKKLFEIFYSHCGWEYVEYEPTIYEVVPYKVTTTKFKRV